MEALKYKIHYIVVNYIGPNRGYASYQNLFKTDPLMMFNKHIEFLKTVDKEVVSATFVFNGDLDPNLKNQLKEFTEFSVPSVIGYYNGPGFSYGAWNEVMKRRLDNCDYFFLIEDDYLPTRPDFYEPFVERCTDESPYVCSYVEERSPGQFCASSSNGLIKAKQCREMLERHGEIFAELNCNTTVEAWHTQINFLNYFTNAGYKMRDILDEYRTNHMLNCNNNTIVSFGNPNAPTLLEPIIIPLP